MKKFYQNKTVIITGASSGIGELIAMEIARLGAKVILLARREVKLQEITKKIQDEGHTASYYPLDVSNQVQVTEVAEAIRKKEKKIDILINNAGIMKLGPFQKLSLNQHEAMVKTNLLGPIYLTHELLPHFIENNAGNIVFVASLVGHINLRNFNTYSATKFSLIGLAEGLRAELRGKNINIHTLCPPATETPLLENAGTSLEHFKAIPVEKAVKCLIKGLAKNKKTIFCSFDSKLLVLIKRICPPLAASLLANY